MDTALASRVLLHQPGLRGGRGRYVAIRPPSQQGLWAAMQDPAADEVVVMCLPKNPRHLCESARRQPGAPFGHRIWRRNPRLRSQNFGAPRMSAGPIFATASWG